MTTNKLPNWRKGATPHQDIRENRVSEALFAVNLSRAIARKGAEEYRDPVLFFELTHLTRTLKSLVLDVLKMLHGEPGTNNIIHLQTNFGGGKTHAELALYHLLTSPDKALSVPRVANLLAENGITEMPETAIAALPCADFDALGRDVAGGLRLHTLWGEMAYRLGGVDRGAELYAIIRDNDEQKTTPGAIKLRELLTAAGPNLILIDELLHYVDKAAAVRVSDSNLGTQTIGFLRELTEAVDSVGHSVLVASVTASDIEDLQVLTEDKAESTLSKLENTLRRYEDSRTPIEGTEIYDIVRARLFRSVDDGVAGQVADAYFQFYKTDPWRDVLPQESRDAGYQALMAQAYPFHPSIVKVLYERWGSRPQFQLTRGTLRFLAHLLAHLWAIDPHEKAIGPLIHLSDVDMADKKVRGEAIRVAGAEWESIIGTDITKTEKDSTAIAQGIDRKRGGLYDRYGLIEGVATSVFMFTHGGQQSRATPKVDVRLAAARPTVPTSDLDQAFDDCEARLYYYYEEDGGYIFKTEPNPNKVLADERANVQTDDARRQVESVVRHVMGDSSLFNVTLYGFHNLPAKEPGDVPDDETLQLVILPPRLTATKSKISGRTADVMDNIAKHYGPKMRMNRNMVLFLVSDSEYVAEAISRAMDWLAAQRVLSDAGLMERFSEAQQEIIRDKAVGAENDTKDHVRKAYNIVVLPSLASDRAIFELSYVPPSKRVLEQAEGELLNKDRLHQKFNPALFDERWASLWPKTAMVITTADLWEKFTRQWTSPILTSVDVLQKTIYQGVEQGLFGYGVMRDKDQDKLQASSYERMYLGRFDALDLRIVEVGRRTLLMRPSQVDTTFPPITKEEISMVLAGPRQTVDAVFKAARKSDTVHGRVDQSVFFAALCEGVKAGLFGYADGPDAPVMRGPDAEITPGKVRFPGLLIGEDVPIPVTAIEVAGLVPTEGRMPVRELQQLAISTYSAERISDQSLFNALQRNVAEGKFGYAATETATIQTGPQAISLDGYVGQPEALPPDTRVIRLSGVISDSMEFAKVMQAAMRLSRLGDSSITLSLRLELKGDVNEHSVNAALSELKGGVRGLDVEDAKG